MQPGRVLQARYLSCSCCAGKSYPWMGGLPSHPGGAASSMHPGSICMASHYRRAPRTCMHLHSRMHNGHLGHPPCAEHMCLPCHFDRCRLRVLVLPLIMH